MSFNTTRRSGTTTLTTSAMIRGCGTLAYQLSRSSRSCFLDELTDAVNVVATEVDGADEVSPTTVARVLAHNGHTEIVIERVFITQNEAHRVAWVETQWRIPLRCRVNINEAYPRRCGRDFLWL